MNILIKLQDVKELLHYTEHFFQFYLSEQTSSTLLNTQITNENLFCSLCYIYFQLKPI